LENKEENKVAKVIVEYKCKSNGQTYYSCLIKGRKLIVSKSKLIKQINEQPKFYDCVVRADGNIYKVSGAVVEELEIGNFLLRDELRQACTDAVKYNKRNAYTAMETYTHQSDLHKVGVVNGMRNTGKTVILLQLAGRGERDAQNNILYWQQSAYISLKYKEYDVATLCAYVANLRRLGIKYIYIDEVTYADGFVDYASGLSDEVDSRFRIVLSGTDTIGIVFAEQESLYHRYVDVKTTPMGYKEYCSLTGRKDVIDYIRSGGVFWENNPNETDLEEYLRTSVVENIYNTIQNMRRVVPAAAKLVLLPKDSLFALCYSICQYGVYELVKAKLDVFDDDIFTEAVKDVLGKSNIMVTPEGKKRIRLASGKPKLHAGVFEPVQVDAAILLMEMCGFLYRTGAYAEDGIYDDHELVFAQTGVAREFVRVVLSGVCRSGVIPANRIPRILARIEENTDGLILECACLSAVIRAAESLDKALQVFRYRWASGKHEIDICVLDTRHGALHLIEIKRSEQEFAFSRGSGKGEPYAGKHLANADCTQPLIARLQPADVIRTLLYRGDDKILNVDGVEVHHRNISEFLVSLEEGRVF